MAELRLDPVTHRWIVTGNRPVMPDVKDSNGACPFCPGNEQMTPKPICECRDSAGAWAVRAFHDRAPVFRIEGKLDPRGEGMFDLMNTVGAHEVVVETRKHGVTLAQLPPDQLARVIEVWRDRIVDLKRDRRFRYISIFKDQGPPSPAQGRHSHSLILATPFLPYQVGIELNVCRLHYQRKERCLYCDIVQQELREEKRIVDQTSDLIAYCPFASRSPYELWVMPLAHSSSFEKDLMDPARLRALAVFLKIALQRVEAISPVLHFVVHTEPNVEGHKPSKDTWKTIPDDYHWHIEIHANLEGQQHYQGSEGFYFNPIPAEQAALILRALEPAGEAAVASGGPPS